MMETLDASDESAAKALECAVNPRRLQYGEEADKNRRGCESGDFAGW